MKSRILRFGFVFGIIIFFIGASIIPSSIGTLNVKVAITSANSRGYIQDLINNATDGDTIYISSGTYYENIKVNKSISLIGEDKDTTIIMPYNYNKDVVIISSNWINLSGFTIRKGRQNYYGIEITSNYNSIKGNIISDNYGTGIGVFGSYNTIMGNDITLNSIDGIEIKSSSHNNIEDNNILNNLCAIRLQTNSNSNTIKGNTISSNIDYGIELYSDNNIINGNTISNNGYGIFFQSSSDSNTITGNHISDNNCGINLHGLSNSITSNTFLNDGLYLETSDNSIVEDNTVNGKPLVYLEDESNEIIDIDAGQIILVNCDDITIQDKEITNTYIGIMLVGTSNSYISNNNINSNNNNGINLYLSNNNIISDNTINSNNESGINIRRSSYNTVSNNFISNNDFGINFLNSDNDNIISDNTINSNNFYGIILSNSNNNKIKGNTIDSNGGDGIWIKISDLNTIEGNNISKNTVGFKNLDLGSYGNIIYHNNFIDNEENAYDNSDIGNTWDDGKFGNFWSDYKQKYPNAKKILQEGIWDTPYEIPDRDNVDNYPLIKQWPKSSTKPTNKIAVYCWLNLFFEQFPNALPIIRNLLGF